MASVTEHAIFVRRRLGGSPDVRRRAWVDRDDLTGIAQRGSHSGYDCILMNPPFSRSMGLGADSHAAVRHLQAALRRLQPGGRLVAVMPDWFGPNARMRDLFETTLRDVSVRTSVRLEKCYLKHGTSIAVRLFVIDKVGGGAVQATIQRGSIRELLGALTVPERSAITTALPPTPKRSSSSSMS